MKTLSVEEAAKNFSTLLEKVERDRTEVTLVRNRRKVARIVPEEEGLPASKMFADLGGVIDKETGAALAKNVAALRKRKTGRLNELRNPWAS
jgi:antitoxin (DNA-binding transcriptional repressor) of toxin-antitoxin stability system